MHEISQFGIIVTSGAVRATASENTQKRVCRRLEDKGRMLLVTSMEKKEVPDSRGTRRHL